MSVISSGTDQNSSCRFSRNVSWKYPVDRICAPLFSRQRHSDGRGGCWSRFSSSPPPGAGAVSSRGCFPSVSRFFAGVLSFVVRGHGVARSARRSFVRSSSSSSSSSSSRSLKQCDKKIAEFDCDRENTKKKGKRKRQHKASVFWVGALCVSKFGNFTFLTHKSRWD